MLNILESQNQLLNQNYTKPALITRIDDNKIWVRVEHDSSSFVMEAINGLKHVSQYTPNVGDQILISGDSFKLGYIIGVINVQLSDQENVLTSQSGAKAKQLTVDQSECLQIEDEFGHVLFEYNSDSKQSKIFAPNGDLSINALHGDIQLNSANNIKCHSIGAVDIQSATAIQARVSGADEQSSINLSNQATSIQTPNFAFKSDEAIFEIEQTQFKGNKVDAAINHSKALFKKLETNAEKIIESAVNVYRNVEQLSQLKTNRMRNIVKKDYQLKSNSTTIHAKQNVNVDGEKINLG